MKCNNLRTKGEGRAVTTLTIATLILGMACSGRVRESSSAASAGGAPNTVTSGGVAGSQGGVAGALVRIPGGGTSGGSTSPAGSGGLDSSSSVADWTKELASAFCDAARDCCKSHLDDSFYETCVGNNLDTIPLTYLKKGSVIVDKNALIRCVMAYRDAAPTCSRRPIDEACVNIVVRDKQIGETCRRNYGGFDCSRSEQETTCLQDAPDSSTGVCTPIIHGAEGDECAVSCTSKAGCPSAFSPLFTPTTWPLAVGCFEEDGLVCSLGSQSPPRCNRTVPRGATCPAYCAYHDTCRSNASGLTTCQGEPREGEPCGDSVRCAEELECSNGTCVPARLGQSASIFSIDTSCSYVFPQLQVMLEQLDVP